MELVADDEAQALQRLKRIMANRRIGEDVPDAFLPLDGSGEPVEIVLGANKVMRLLDRAGHGVMLVAHSLFLSSELKAAIIERTRASGVPTWGIRKSAMEIASVIGGLGRSSCMCFALRHEGSSIEPLHALRLFVQQRLVLLPVAAEVQQAKRPKLAR